MNTKVNLLSLSGVLITALAGPAAHAGLPGAYRALPKGLKNPNGVSLMGALDERNPKETKQDMVYYFPTGKMKLPVGITNFNQTVLDSRGRRGAMCESLDEKFKAQKVIEAQNDNLYSLALKDLARIQKEIEQSRFEMSKNCAAIVSSEDQIKDIELRVQAVEVDMVIARRTYVDCLKAGVATSDQCYEPLNKLILEKERLLTESAKLRSDIRDGSRECNRSRSEVAEIEKQGNLVVTNMGRIEALVESHMGGIRTRYGTVDGGRLASVWDDGFQQAKQEIESLNPGVQVVQLPRRLLNFYLGGFEKAGDASLPFSLGYTSSAGNAFKPILKANGQFDTSVSVERGTVREDGANSENEKLGPYYSLLAHSPFNVTDDVQAPSAGAVSLQMSVPGACAVLAMKENGTGKPGAVMAMSYVFGSGSSVHARASYNLWNIYNRIEKAGTRSSGFLGFTKTRYHELTESIREGDDFSFSFYPEDPVDAANEQAIRTELKKELMGRVAQSFATFGATPQLGAAPEKASIPGWTNASIVEPNWWFFGRIGFNVLEGIFGHQRSELKINKTWNKTVTEEWNYTRITPMVATFSMELVLEN